MPGAPAAVRKGGGVWGSVVLLKLNTMGGEVYDHLGVGVEGPLTPVSEIAIFSNWVWAHGWSGAKVATVESRHLPWGSGTL